MAVTKNAKRQEKVGPPKKDPTKDQIKLAMQLCSVGFSLAALGDEFGVCQQTMQRWRNEFPEFEEAIRKGRANRRRRAYTCFYQQAFPVDEKGKPTGKGEPALMTFWMKTREGFKQKQHLEISTGSDAAPTIQFALKDNKPKEIEPADEKPEQKKPRIEIRRKAQPN